MSKETCTTMDLTVQDVANAVNYLINSAVVHRTRTYTELATAMGRPTAWRQMGYLLDAVRDHCITNGWPWLSALVVDKNTGHASWGENASDAFAEMTKCFTFFGQPFRSVVSA